MGKLREKKKSRNEFESPAPKTQSDQIAYSVSKPADLPDWQEEARREFLKVLTDSNAKALRQVDLLLTQVRVAFWTSLVVYGFGLLIGLAAIISGSWLVASIPSMIFRQYIAAGSLVAGLVILTILFYQNPLRSLRQAMADLLRANVILLGYLNQINQVNASLGSEGGRARETRAAISQALDEAEAILAESDE